MAEGREELPEEWARAGDEARAGSRRDAGEEGAISVCRIDVKRLLACST